MRTKIIGIAGGSASGKSTLTRHLFKMLPRTEIIAMDNFFLEDQSGGPFATSVSDGTQHFDLNHPDAFDLAQIVGRMDDLIQQQEAPSHILVDGSFSLTLEALRRRMHLKVFVWLDDDIRVGRKIARNYQERGKDPAVTLQNYLNSGRPGHERFIVQTAKYADVILHGERNPDENARIVATLIHSL